MYFKSDRIKDEWEQTAEKLKNILELANDYCGIEEPDYRGVTITCLGRTKEEQDDIYRGDDRYAEKPWPSVHMTSPIRGADIRVSDMPGNLPFKLYKVLEQITYDPARPNKKSVVYGDERHQNHIHIQVWTT